jgi:hypothetical protein
MRRQPEKLFSLACEQLKSGETEYDKIVKVKTIELAEMATTVCENSYKWDFI